MASSAAQSSVQSTDTDDDNWDLPLFKDKYFGPWRGIDAEFDDEEDSERVRPTMGYFLYPAPSSAKLEHLACRPWLATHQPLGALSNIVGIHVVHSTQANRSSDWSRVHLHSCCSNFYTGYEQYQWYIPTAP